MAKPLHRVQLQKQESLAGGGDAADDDSMLWDVLDAAEDAPDLNGVYLQTGALRDKLVTLYRDTDNQLYFEDTANAGAARKSLTQLAAAGVGGMPAATQMGQVLYSVDGSAFTVRLPLTSCHGWLINDAGEHLVNG